MADYGLYGRERVESREGSGVGNRRSGSLSPANKRMLDYKLMVMVECDRDYAISAYYAYLLLCHSVLFLVFLFFVPAICLRAVMFADYFP